ncbi:hypothetical protein [Streptomyces sp. Qhu_M48]|uniref:hypothetical protein n=1 Tax=Streptomyces sp. Qhu_M48 TaxID=3435889 RepID=UPI003F4FDCCC
MGEVHRAEDLGAGPGDADRVAAVKLILRRRSGPRVDTHGDTKTLERFTREVRITQASGRRPHLPRATAGGLDDTTGDPPCLATELLDGSLWPTWGTRPTGRPGRPGRRRAATADFLVPPLVGTGENDTCTLTPPPGPRPRHEGTLA